MFLITNYNNSMHCNRKMQKKKKKKKTSCIKVKNAIPKLDPVKWRTFWTKRKEKRKTYISELGHI